MIQVAKLFMNGRSQALRLPQRYRFDCDQVYIRKDAKTGDVIISKKPNSWADYFTLVDRTHVPQDFMAQRDNEVEADKDLF